MTSTSAPTPHLYLVVGYDGSPPARRALDAAVSLRQGRAGHITVVYVAHMASTAMLSAGAVVEMDKDFDEVEAQLRNEADERLRDQEPSWSFERREGIISDDLLAVAKETQEAHPGDSVVLVVGSSSHPVHRVVGSVAVSLARHSPVPVVVVP